MVSGPRDSRLRCFIAVPQHSYFYVHSILHKIAKFFKEIIKEIFPNKNANKRVQHK